MHICGRSRTARFLLRRRSRRDRMRSKVHEIGDALRQHGHAPLDDQGSWLGKVVRGYFADHAVPTNKTALNEFRDIVRWHRLRAIRRRVQKDRSSWASINRLAERWIPKPRTLHPWPSERFAVKHPRRQPSALIGPVRLYAGAAWQCASLSQSSRTFGTMPYHARGCPFTNECSTLGSV